MKYVPTLRLRGEERMAIRHIDFSSKSMPLIEIMQEKPDKRFKGSFESVNLKQLNYIKVPFMVDIPLYYTIKGSKKPIQTFLGQAQRSDKFLLDKYKSLAKNKNLIPVISYDPSIDYDSKRLLNNVKTLRRTFDKLAFRIYYKSFDSSLKDIENIIKVNENIIFDIDESPENNKVFTDKYNDLQKVKAKTGCNTILLKATIPDNITNVGLEDNQPIPQADNGILYNYSKLGFDAFGDYSGIKKDKKISDGGTISPGFIYYCYKDNIFIGYSHRTKELSEFKNYIIPNLTTSTYWGSYNKHHKTNCPGCKKIINIKNNKESGESQGKWKRIAIMHYLYTVEEFL